MRGTSAGRVRRVRGEVAAAAGNWGAARYGLMVARAADCRPNGGASGVWLRKAGAAVVCAIRTCPARRDALHCVREADEECIIRYRKCGLEAVF